MKKLAALLSILIAAAAVFPSYAAERDSAVRKAFQKSHPCPANGKRSGACPGYVVDHVKPLCAGGSDHVSNMQWQTVTDAKKKDKREVAECRARR